MREALREIPFVTHAQHCHRHTVTAADSSCSWLHLHRERVACTPLDAFVSTALCAIVVYTNSGNVVLDVGPQDASTKAATDGLSLPVPIGWRHLHGHGSNSPKVTIPFTAFGSFGGSMSLASPCIF